MNPVQSSSGTHDRADQNLVERFLVAFNQIHQYCRDQTGAPEAVSFVYLVTEHGRKNEKPLGIVTKSDVVEAI